MIIISPKGWETQTKTKRGNKPMLGRPNAQCSFGDLQASSRVSESHFLLRIDREINWNHIRSRLERLYHPDMGRPGFPPLMLLKVLLLQQWYNLSDPEAEEAIRDRLSFQRFLGLSLTDPVPDETTICRFRGRLLENRLYEWVFQEINRQLEKKGLIIKQGSIIDATLVKAHYKPATPQREAKDPEASWTAKQDEPHYGYKAHATVDQGSELIRKVEITPAHIHDNQLLEEMVLGDEQVVYADKGYSSSAHKEYLHSRGISSGIMEKATRGHPLAEWQKKRNKFISRARSAVERCFGVLKEHYGYVRVRYRGIMRNRCQLYLLASAFNLKRMLRLCAT